MADDPLAKLGVPAFGSPVNSAATPAAAAASAPAKTADPLASLGVPAFASTTSDVSKPIMNPMEMVGAATEAEGDPEYVAGQREALKETGTGFAKKAGETVSTVSHILHKIPGVGETLAPQQGITALDKMDQIKEPGENIGAGIETGTEFILGDEVLSGLLKGAKFVELAEKYPAIARALNLAKDHPWFAKTLMESTKGASVGAVEGATHSPGARVQGAVEGAKWGAGVGAASGAVQGVPELKIKNPFRQAIEGAKVAQEPAQAAVREGVSAAGSPVPANAPMVTGNQTILDNTIADVSKQAKAAYQQVDDVVGFDLKAEKQALANDQYKIKQLGNTPADQAARKATQAAIDDSTNRIAIAEAKLKAANVDPAAADQLFTKQKAAETMRKVIANSTLPDGTVKVDSLIRQSQALRFTKYGDRLEQLMGKQAAQQYMDDLVAAQKAGIHAMKVQKIALWTAGLLGLSGSAVAHLL